MKTLFDTTELGSLILKNRFVRSATWEGMATEGGAVTEELIEMMLELVHGEVGLIITGYAYVSPEGQASRGQMAVHDDRCLPGLTRMAQAVHAAGGKIALQIVHGGLFANSELSGTQTMGPSAGGKSGRAMSKKDIEDTISAFTQAAARAQKAGFDAVQLHGAHGFLLSQFLTPAFNQRSDEYGGSLENRARFLVETVESIRKQVGPEYPILIKLNSEDFLENGMTMEEAMQVAAMLEKASLNAIEFSGGTVASREKYSPPRPGPLKGPENEVYYREAANLYKKHVTIPLMLVGGIRSYEVARELVQGGIADYISMGRPFIAEPGLVKRWREGEDRSRVECGSCNLCFEPASAGHGLYCVPLGKK